MLLSCFNLSGSRLPSISSTSNLNTASRWVVACDEREDSMNDQIQRLPCPWRRVSVLWLVWADGSVLYYAAQLEDSLEIGVLAVIGTAG